MAPQDTIFALSTAAGKAGLAVVRVSGPDAGQALLTIAGRDQLPPPRRMIRAAMKSPGKNRLIDRGLAVWFQGPASATGEDLVEFHSHGSRAVVDSLLSALATLPGLRLAEPGEFTRRAFDAGKLDLAEIEGLADLIEAETEAQRRQALALMEGQLSYAVANWRQTLLSSLAHWEATIDFPDEDLPDDLVAQSRRTIESLAKDMAAALEEGDKAERVRAGIKIAIVGPPNAGKSSLLNRLAARDAAIVSQQAGTTRDVIEIHLDLGGFPVSVSDTAGLRDLHSENEPVGPDEIEIEGMRRTRQLTAQADLIIILFDIAQPIEYKKEITELVDSRCFLVGNKSDLVGDTEGLLEAIYKDNPVYYISTKTGDAVEGLVSDLRRAVAARFAVPQSAPFVARDRQASALADCIEALERYGRASLPELAAEDLRSALHALDRLVGRSDVEDLLDVIFRDFCIGK